MNKLLPVATAAIVTLMAHTANAGQTMTSRGVVAAVDIAAGSLVLADGEAFRMVDPDLLYGYGRGDAVIVNYEAEQNQSVGRGLYRVPMSGAF